MEKAEAEKIIAVKSAEAEAEAKHLSGCTHRKHTNTTMDNSVRSLVPHFTVEGDCTPHEWMITPPDNAH
jgi:hypothetical protein